MKNTRSLIMLVMILVLACTDNDIRKGKSGYFILSQLQVPVNGRSNRVNQAVNGDPVTDFNLGYVKASREFFFVLGNGGDNPIFDITLETSDPNFIISPTAISNLNGVDSPSGSIIPIVSLGVVHGTHINGVGFTDILQMGINEAVVIIKGKTIENGDTIELESRFNFVVDAKVMDIKMSENEEEIDLLDVTITTSGVPNAGGLGAVPGYIVPLSARSVNIKNTGNVDMTITSRSLDAQDFSNEIEVAPNESAEINLLPANHEELAYTMMVITIDGHGTIADNNRIKMGNDGKGYFIVSRQ